MEQKSVALYAIGHGLLWGVAGALLAIPVAPCTVCIGITAAGATDNMEVFMVGLAAVPFLIGALKGAGIAKQHNDSIAARSQWNADAAAAEERLATCPHCRSRIPREATVCAHCTRSVAPDAAG